MSRSFRPKSDSAGARSARRPGTEEFWQLPYEEARASFEKGYLLQVLEQSGGNISQAAARMGIHRQTLQYKLKQLGIRKSWAE